MMFRGCTPVIPSADLEKSLRFWKGALGFEVEAEMREGEKLIFCMLRRDSLRFMLNRRAGLAVTPNGYEGIRLYWAPVDIQETRNRLTKEGFAPSEIVEREYGQTEFFVADDDGFSHCFGVPTTQLASLR
jgi:catechol 2,3-dioxygenase-like lactoylglutathione lyase family enzyme